MTSFDKQRIIEVVLYILNKTGGIDYYHLFKILYFANQRSLVEWGQLMITDKFCALPHGPVPTELYNTIKGQQSVLPDMKKIFMLWTTIYYQNVSLMQITYLNMILKF